MVEPKQVLSFGGSLCAFLSSAYGRFLLEENHLILLIASVLMCVCLCVLICV